MSKMLYAKRRKNRYLWVDLCLAYHVSQETTFKFHRRPGMFTLFAILMLFFVIGGTYNFYKVSFFKTHGILTTGTITSYQAYTCSQHSREIEFKVRFFATHHQSVTIESYTTADCSSIEDTNINLKSGQKINILYNPDNPQDAIVTTFPDDFPSSFTAIAFIFMGSLGLIFYTIKKIRLIIIFFQIREDRKLKRPQRAVHSKVNTTSRTILHKQKESL